MPLRRVSDAMSLRYDDRNLHMTASRLAAQIMYQIEIAIRIFSSFFSFLFFKTEKPAVSLPFPSRLSFTVSYCCYRHWSPDAQSKTSASLACIMYSVCIDGGCSYVLQYVAYAPAWILQARIICTGRSLRLCRCLSHVRNP